MGETDLIIFQRLWKEKQKETVADELPRKPTLS